MKRTITIVIGLILTAILVTLSVAARSHRWYSNESNTYGWEIMTPEEQSEYHARMQNLSNYSACRVHIAEHTRKMDARAREKGVILPAIQTDTCDIMQGRHMFRLFGIEGK